MTSSTAIEDPVVIIGMARTPMGNFRGALADHSAAALGGVAIAGALRSAGLDPGDVGDRALVRMGCVLPAGQGQAPARQAARDAGLGWVVPCSTVNKMCGSGMEAVILGHGDLISGSADLVVAGGMESMSNAPHILADGRQGVRMGHGVLRDHMLADGLEDAFLPGARLMGCFAEDTAQAYQFSRADQDAYALQSLERAHAAQAAGVFADEIVSVTTGVGAKATVVREDEAPQTARPQKIPHLRPAFDPEGTVTAANASSISDGAAAVVMTRASVAEARGWRPIARLVGHAVHAQEPQWFTTAPVGAVRRLLERMAWSVPSVDAWEINEAFAVVAMVAQRELALPMHRLNIHGGACALGHPIGASGARILVSLVTALRRIGGRRGVASICIGGGEATAMGVELWS